MVIILVETAVETTVLVLEDHTISVSLSTLEIWKLAPSLLETNVSTGGISDDKLSEELEIVSEVLYSPA